MITKETFVELRDFFANTLKKLKCSDKRAFCAELALSIGHGGQSLVAKELGVSRKTIRKGIQEVKSGIVCLDACNLRHRPPIEKKLPHLLKDIQSILDSQSQTDPRFKTKRLYARITVRELRKQLIEQKGYSDDELPTDQTLNNKLNQLDYTLKRVKKTIPLKKIPETDAIFEQLHQVNREADVQKDTVRVSMDAKTTVKLGNLSRGGMSRVGVHAGDHDFSKETVTPFGFYYPKFPDFR